MMRDRWEGCGGCEGRVGGGMGKGGWVGEWELEKRGCRIAHVSPTAALGESSNPPCDWQDDGDRRPTVVQLSWPRLLVGEQIKG
jgi:hypothetical protein